MGRPAVAGDLSFAGLDLRTQNELALFQNAMERYARQIREGRVLKVGVNAHRMSDEEDTLLRDVAAMIERGAERKL